MNAYVADTHALLWCLTGAPQLGANASRAFDEGEQGQAVVFIPAIVIAELYFVTKKFALTLDFAAELITLQQSVQFEFVPFEAKDALDFDMDARVSEMHDCIIIGVARGRNAVLLTRDLNIIEAKIVPTLW